MDPKHRNASDHIGMPRVNAYPSRKKWEEACWQKLLRAKDWLGRIVSPYERRIIVMRAAAIHLLHAGMSYRDIGRELWLSPQTISAIKKGIREARYRSYAERGKTERKKRVYSANQSHVPRRNIKIGIPRKTKYGTIYL